MATHSSILAWRIPRTGAWWATAHGVAKSRSDTTEQLSGALVPPPPKITTTRFSKLKWSSHSHLRVLMRTEQNPRKALALPGARLRGNVCEVAWWYPTWTVCLPPACGLLYFWSFTGLFSFAILLATAPPWWFTVQSCHFTKSLSCKRISKITQCCCYLTFRKCSIHTQVTNHTYQMVTLSFPPESEQQTLKLITSTTLKFTSIFDLTSLMSW